MAASGSGGLANTLMVISGLPVHITSGGLTQELSPNFYKSRSAKETPKTKSSPLHLCQNIPGQSDGAELQNGDDAAVSL